MKRRGEAVRPGSCMAIRQAGGAGLRSLALPRPANNLVIKYT
jgi:hypothetical protein